MPTGSTRTKRDERAIKRAIDRVIAGQTYTKSARRLGVRGDYLAYIMRVRGIVLPRRMRIPGPFRRPDTVAEIAYIAGIVDGEGSLSRVTNRERSWRFCVYNTDRALIDWLCTFGGLSYTRNLVALNRGKGFKSLRPQYGWAMNRRVDLLPLLRAIRPYLIIKAARADEAIADLEEALRPAKRSATR